jgi:hypothetical protein
MLTDPKRGIAWINDVYVETDLKIKDHEGQDRELSKGLLNTKGKAGRNLDRCVVGLVCG